MEEGDFRSGPEETHSRAFSRRDPARSGKHRPLSISIWKNPLISFNFFSTSFPLFFVTILF